MFSILLACSLVALLTITPQASSQTVVTSYQYSATSLTITVYSTTLTTGTSSQAVQYASTPYYYNGATGSFPLGQTEFGNMLYFDREDYPCLYYDSFVFNATQGHVIRISFELSMPGRALTFLILNSAQYWSFEHTNCAYNPPNALLQAFAPAYSVSWTVPQSGYYAFVFLSPIFYGGQVNLLTQDYAPFTQSETVTYMSTSMIENTNAIISTETSAAASMTQPSSGSAFTVPVWLPIVLVVAAGVAIVLMFKKYRG